MANSAIRYRKQEGPHGTMMIVETGRCIAGDISAIEGGCTRRYMLAPLPAAAGVILKPLDGTTPTPSSIALYGAGGATYSCVKVGAVVNPLAHQQTGGPFSGGYVYSYEITWQQVAGVA